MAQFLTVVYFMFFLLMPCYSGTGDNLGVSGLLLFVIALLLTLGGLYLWWFETPNLAASMKWFYSIVSVVLLFLFGIKPGWIKADTVKPVPERLT